MGARVIQAARLEEIKAKVVCWSAKPASITNPLNHVDPFFPRHGLQPMVNRLPRCVAFYDTPEEGVSIFWSLPTGTTSQLLEILP